MAKKYKNKYRIQSVRLRYWNYAWNAPYFITICTHGMECFFGDVVDGKMILSEMGHIVEEEWLETFNMRPDMNLVLGEFQVMPNHFHAIIGIGENVYNEDKTGILNQDEEREYLNKFGPQKKNLSSIIRGFKSAVTIENRKIHADFEWQGKFHDHIIRNERAYIRIANYIKNNPANWQQDKFYK